MEAFLKHQIRVLYEISLIFQFKCRKFLAILCRIFLFLVFFPIWLGLMIVTEVLALLHIIIYKTFLGIIYSPLVDLFALLEQITCFLIILPDLMSEDFEQDFSSKPESVKFRNKHYKIKRKASAKRIKKRNEAEAVIEKYLSSLIELSSCYALDCLEEEFIFHSIIRSMIAIEDLASKNNSMLKQDIMHNYDKLVLTALKNYFDEDWFTVDVYYDLRMMTYRYILDRWKNSKSHMLIYTTACFKWFIANHDDYVPAGLSRIDPKSENFLQTILEETNLTNNKTIVIEKYEDKLSKFFRDNNDNLVNNLIILTKNRI